MTGTIMEPLGLKVNPMQNTLATNPAGENEGEASTEKLGDVLRGSDLVFYSSDLQLKPSEFLAPLLTNPLYTGSTAVAAGHAWPIGKSTIAGFGDANFLLDQVEVAVKDLG